MLEQHLFKSFKLLLWKSDDKKRIS